MKQPAPINRGAAIFAVLFTILIIFAIYKHFEDAPQFNPTVSNTDSLVNFTDPKYLSPKDSSNSISYYSETKPSDEAIGIYKKTVAVLNKQNIDFCELYKQIDEMASETDQEAEAKYPANPDRAAKYGEKLFEKGLRRMMVKNGLSDE